MNLLKEFLNYQKENNELFNHCLNDYYGEDRFNPKEKVDIESLDLEDKKIELYYLLKTEFKIKEYNLNKFAKTIQNSRSGIGGSVMTRFHCKFCGEEEVWGNNNTPGICFDCAKDMAKKMIKDLKEKTLDEKLKN
jgi:hypothetical protein